MDNSFNDADAHTSVWYAHYGGVFAGQVVSDLECGVYSVFTTGNKECAAAIKSGT